MDYRSEGDNETLCCCTESLAALIRVSFWYPGESSFGTETDCITPSHHTSTCFQIFDAWMLLLLSICTNITTTADNSEKSRRPFHSDSITPGFNQNTWPPFWFILVKNGWCTMVWQCSRRTLLAMFEWSD